MERQIMSKYVEKDCRPYRYAVTRIWKDFAKTSNSRVEVVEYFHTVAECEEYIASRKTSRLYDWDIGEYQ
jgi:hypothetical protein